MKNDGKGLENFVRQIEDAFSGPTLTITQNRRVFSDNGAQLAELDIEIEGSADGINTHILIECRDRPSQGKAPSSWIQQMAGRRLQFEFTKVIAVSTTGFSEGALAAAQKLGIELRELTTNSPPPSVEWSRTSRRQSNYTCSFELIQAQIGLPKTIKGKLHSHLQKTIRDRGKTNIKFFQQGSETSATLREIWGSIWYHEVRYFSKLLNKHGFLRTTICRKFVDEYQIWLITDQVCVAIDAVFFLVELSAERVNPPSVTIEDYREVGNPNPLSTTEVTTLETLPKGMELLTETVHFPDGGSKYRVGFRTQQCWRPPSSQVDGHKHS